MKRPSAGMSPKPKAPETPPSMPGEVSLVKAEPGVAARAKVKSEPLPPIPKPDAVAMAKKLKRLAEKGESFLPDMYKKCKTQQEKRELFLQHLLPRPFSQLQRNPKSPQRSLDGIQRRKWQKARGSCPQTLDLWSYVMPVWLA